ncbi:MAG: deoxyguanosinetriphosphate triphosphohydrolase [Pseudomonadota bacterium]|nr:deoxyguanosinetriphosphate triphosphohydrolase [Pseudomonadota bacterium]
MPGPAGSRPLAPYACDPADSRGRRVSEPASHSRSDFQRDRDRIVHSTAFRRLTYKTQVFVFHEGDHYRNRLTHSLEVAQIARSIARTLGLEEDLAEAIALAHDLGHPPFGHAGEKALDAAMTPWGGFDHNAQSLRIVTSLERRYAAFDGLNLTWETLEGLVKHNGPLTDREGTPIGAYAGRALPAPFVALDEAMVLGIDRYASAEAQVAALADDIAYNTHDIDDGVRAGLITIADLRDVPLTGPILRQIEEQHSGLDEQRMVHELTRRLITLMVDDVVAEARRRVLAMGVVTVDELRAAPGPVIGLSRDVDAQCDELKFFLLSWVYRNSRISRIMGDAQRVVSELFTHYLKAPESLPGDWRPRSKDGDRAAMARDIADFIAGMTDRYALGEHMRLFDVTPDLR